MVVFGVVELLVMLGMMARWMSADAPIAAAPPMILIVIAWVLALYVSLLPTFLMAALLMLIVDLARNARAIRYQ